MKSQDIVLVSFPFSDQSQIKLRPAIILSTKGIAGDCIILAITTQKLSNIKHEVEINNTNLTKGKLPQKSFIRLAKIATIERKLIKQKVARLNDQKWNEVQKKLQKVLFG